MFNKRGNLEGLTRQSPESLGGIQELAHPGS